MAAILAAMSLNGSLIHVSAAENNGSEDDFANQIAAGIFPAGNEI